MNPDETKMTLILPRFSGTCDWATLVDTLVDTVDRYLRRVIDWIRTNPDQAARMTAFTGGISKELEAPDRAFTGNWKHRACVCDSGSQFAGYALCAERSVRRCGAV